MRRSEYGPDEHPELEVLLARGDGLMDADVAQAIDTHLETCPLCRLELKQAARFADLDQDDAAADEADWQRMAPRLDAAWRDHGRSEVPQRQRPVPRWLVPAVAAAVIALVVVNVGERAMRTPHGSGEDTLRGGPVAGPVIVDLAPQGELGSAPNLFTWHTEHEFKAYNLEIFTDDLESVFSVDGLQDPQAQLPDSLRSLLLEGRTYFWHVQGQEGLTAVEASETVWFRIGPETD